MILIAGPCVIEDYATTYKVALELRDMCRVLGIPFIFKASYDKANRTSINSFRGVSGGLDILARIKSELGVRVVSDVHRVSEVKKAAEVLDVIQIPALLCRQTDLVVAIARTGKPISVKKGQFMSPFDMGYVVEKIRSTGNDNIMLVERGTTFGYNNLVVDMRSIDILGSHGCSVIFDATHSVQYPGGACGSSGGDRRFVPTLARAAVAAGADGVFIECHPDPDNALCDGPNSVYLNDMPRLVGDLVEIYQLKR